MVFQRPHRGDEHDHVGPQPRLAALDVDELLGTEVGTEAGFGDHVVAELQRSAGRDHRVAAVRDVRERTTVDEGGVVLERLDQVRPDRIAQQCGHCTVRLQLRSRHRRAFSGVADDDAAEAALQVRKVVGEAKDRHHFRSDDDVETVFTRVAVGRAAEAGGDLAQRAVVHVHHAPPGDAANVESERVAVVDVVVDQRREQVVRERDGAEVAGEVQVDVFHRHDLRAAAAGRTALQAEHRADRRLAQADDRFLPDAIQRVAETDRGRRLAFAGRRRVDRADEDQLAVGATRQAADVRHREFRLVATVEVERVIGDAEAIARHHGDRLEGGRARYGDVSLDVGGHGVG